MPLVVTPNGHVRHGKRRTKNPDIFDDIAAAGKVVVCSTHDLAEAALVADDVVFLREGRAFAVRREDSARDFDREQLLATYRGA